MVIGVDIRTLMEAQYSGIPGYTYDLLHQLLACDQTNKYVLFYNTTKKIDISKWRFNQPNVWLAGCSWPNKLYNASNKFLNRPRIDRFIKQDIDLWYMPHFNFISLPGNKKIKKIITIHDLSFLRYPEFFSIYKNLWHQAINIKKLLLEFDQLIAISQNTKRDLVELCHISPDKIKVVPSAINSKYQVLDKTSGELRKFRQQMNLPEKFILYLGTLEPRKNIESLILAYNNLRQHNPYLYDYQLIIAGGQGWKYEQIYQLAEQSPYQHDINFLGYVKEQDKVKLYNLASLFVFPSFYEGFGFPPLEAAACGIPTITSFASSLPEVMTDASLLIDPYNVQQLSLAIQQVLTNEALYQELVDKGLQRAREFNWQQTAEEYLQIFSNLTNNYNNDLIKN